MPKGESEINVKDDHLFLMIYGSVILIFVLACVFFGWHQMAENTLVISAAVVISRFSCGDRDKCEAKDEVS